MTQKDMRSVVDRGLLGVGRGVLRGVDEQDGIQLVQVEALKNEVIDGAEHMERYGMAAHPLPGAEPVVLANAGSRNHPLVIAITDRRYRPALEPGEVVIHDDQGQVVHLTRDGITVRTSKTVRVEATRVEIVAAETARIEAQTVEIHGSDHVRIDAGGAGVTYWPDRTDDWRKGLPKTDIPPAPPEHEP